MLNEIEKKMNVPGFYALHAIYLIGAEKLGRRNIAKEINLSESKARTMLNYLIKYSYIKATRGAMC